MAEKKNSWQEVKKRLECYGQPELVGAVGELHALSPANRDFIEARFLEENDGDSNVLARYKERIVKYLAPPNPWSNNQPISIKEAKKAMSDYKKATGNQFLLIDLMVHYVESGTNFSMDYGDMDAPYYNSLASVFGNALKLMHQFPVERVTPYIERLRTVVKKADGCIGWGYADEIEEMLNEAYPDR